MSDDNNDPIDIAFTSTSIGGHNFNINNPDFPTISSFESIIPFYDPENGLYLKMKTYDGKNIIQPLPLTVSNNMSGLPQDATDQEYVQMFCDRKRTFLTSLITQIYGAGFVAPSSVQMVTLVPLFQGKDAIVQFKSGTGKSLSFMVGTLWHFDPANPALQNVFITSSHEVAKQLFDLARSLVPEAKIALCIGQKQAEGGFASSESSGNSMKKQMEEAKTHRLSLRHLASSMIC